MKYALLFLAFVPIPSVRLSPQTVKEFNAYMEVADRTMNKRALEKVRISVPPDGEPRVTSWEPDGPRGLTDGLVHDWVAAAFIPGAKAADVVAVLKDYGHYTDMYKPDLLETRVISEKGEKRVVTMRTVKKKAMVTVTLDIEYDVEYRTFPNGRVQVWSRSKNIQEVENAGRPDESRTSADHGSGFLWRLNTYWQVEDRDGGVYLECRAISLTRDIPAIAAWVVKPMVTALPRESLTNTLQATREAVQARIKN